MNSSTQLSKAAYIWGKASKTDDGEQYWLPLWMHLQDTMGVSQKLWDYWLPENIKSLLSQDLHLTQENTKSFLEFLAGIHDLGKATPDFSGRKNVVFRTQGLYDRLKINQTLPQIKLSGVMHTDIVSVILKVNKNYQCFIKTPDQGVYSPRCGAEPR
jgi:hypothetical protein